MSKKTKRKNWSWSTGTRPFTVRVTECKAGGNIYVVRIRNGRQVMRSLGHRDRELAKAKAREISLELAKGFLDREGDFRRRPLRIGELINAYEAHGLHGRSERYRGTNRERCVGSQNSSETGKSFLSPSPMFTGTPTHASKERSALGNPYASAPYGLNSPPSRSRAPGRPGIE